MVGTYVRVSFSKRGDKGTIVARHPDLEARIEEHFQCPESVDCVNVAADAVQRAFKGLGRTPPADLNALVQDAIVEGRQRHIAEQEAEARERVETSHRKARVRRGRGKAQRVPRRLPSAAEPPATALSSAETRQLSECEAVVQAGVRAFVTVGVALQTIRDERLYRGEFRTFAAYVEGRWRLSERSANRFIAAAGIERVVGPVGPTPVSESVLRPLAVLRLPDDSLDESAVKAVWTKAAAKAGDKPVTARVVAEAVRLHLGQAGPGSQPTDWRERALDSLRRIVESTPEAHRAELLGLLGEALGGAKGGQAT